MPVPFVSPLATGRAVYSLPSRISCLTSSQVCPGCGSFRCASMRRPSSLNCHSGTGIFSGCSAMLSQSEDRCHLCLHLLARLTQVTPSPGRLTRPLRSWKNGRSAHSITDYTRRRPPRRPCPWEPNSTSAPTRNRRGRASSAPSLRLAERSGKLPGPRARNVEARKTRMAAPVSNNAKSEISAAWCFRIGARARKRPRCVFGRGSSPDGTP